MAQIPASINGVMVEFAASVGNDVDDRMIAGLKHCISTQIAPGHALSRIYISSAADSHAMPSRHAQNKAVDISRINGTKIAIGYPQGGAVKAIVDAIQQSFESYGFRRENYGPHLKRKSGSAHAVGGHQDHIHLSVD